jgi:hypothetical protein
VSSLSRTLYTGVTNNLERRVAAHKARRPGSFTARYNIVARFEQPMSPTGNPGFLARQPRGRVASGDCSPEAPTDPDVQVYRIRLFGPRLHGVTGKAHSVTYPLAHGFARQLRYAPEFS